MKRGFSRILHLVTVWMAFSASVSAVLGQPFASPDRFSGNLFSLNIGPDHEGNFREIDARNLSQTGEMIRRTESTDRP